MKCYGYAIGNSNKLKELSEVGLLATPKELRSLAKFLIHCADEVPNIPEWEHEHFSDFDSSQDSSCDIIVNKISNE